MKIPFVLVVLMFTTLQLDAQVKQYEALVKQLQGIHNQDQVYRNQLKAVHQEFGAESQQMKTLIEKARIADSLNLVAVEVILEKYGWLGAEEIGYDGNSTLFLVIQHSPLEAQTKYLPMMRDAVANGKAEARSLALLEDRVALRQGKRQLYGSQISWDMKTNEYFVLPLEDPDNVDQRRAKMGLGTLAEYVSHFNMKWNVEEYKKELPAIEAKYRATLQQSERK
ncbi:MAG TPA: DUF6624 domain-containing protein [Chryseosolibacter sp.]